MLLMRGALPPPLLIPQLLKHSLVFINARPVVGLTLNLTHIICCKKYLRTLVAFWRSVSTATDSRALLRRTGGGGGGGGEGGEKINGSHVVMTMATTANGAAAELWRTGNEQGGRKD